MQLSEQQAMLGFNRLVIAALTLVLGLLVVIFFLIRSRQRRKLQMKERDRELTAREALIRASIQSQENERKRFARDLHDGLGQLITFLRLSLSDITPDSSVEQRVTFMDKAEGLLGEMHKEIRSIAFNLMPQTLVQQGLVPALREMAERINQGGKVVVRISSFDVPSRLAEVQEISLYRVIQEWINNILKYSDATVVEVQLVGHDDDINLTIEDNGNGFSTQRLEISPGNGWKNIRSRVNLLKGSVEIDSSEGRSGTTLMVRVPVHPVHIEAQKVKTGEG